LPRFFVAVWFVPELNRMVRTNAILPLLVLGASSGCDGRLGTSNSDASDAGQPAADSSEPGNLTSSGDAAPSDAAASGDSVGASDAPGAADAQSIGAADAAEGSVGPNACSPGATQCDGGTPQTCVSGSWQSGAPCSGATPYCALGVCTGQFPSCYGGGAGTTSDCGPSGTSDCCASLAVPGGMFYRGSGTAAPATVSDFRLDAYEITVGRFRKFVSAVAGGWLPPAGSGKHTHLNGGMGLVGEGAAGGYEPGWNAGWNPAPPTQQYWDQAFATCNPADNSAPTWTSSPGANETRPINCIGPFAAYAFCIWDGGFLPTNAEWDYAKSGGSEQRIYPWPSTTIDATYATYGCTSSACGPQILPVGSHPKGNGKWGQADLAGSVEEWVLDVFAAWNNSANHYPLPCSDCVSLPSGEPHFCIGDPAVYSCWEDRDDRGGDYSTPESNVASAVVWGNDVFMTPGSSYVGWIGQSTMGARCARSP
jgi:formylglycine-generating enzyme required for sulfatase activity